MTEKGLSERTWGVGTLEITLKNTLREIRIGAYISQSMLVFLIGITSEN